MNKLQYITSKCVFDFCLMTNLKVSSHALQVSDDPLGSGPWCGVGTWQKVGLNSFLSFIGEWLSLILYFL